MKQLIQWGSFILVVAIFGWLLTEFVPDYYQTIIAICGINVILAVSLNLVNGFTGQFSMGHAGFMAVGAYMSATLSTLLLPALGFSGEMNVFTQNLLFFGVLIVSGLSAGLIGFLVGVPSLRLKGDYLAIVTLGFGEIIRTSILNIEAIGGARGFIGIPQWSNLYWVLGLSILSTVIIARVVTSIPGKQFMAVRDDETATTSIGLSTTRIKVRAFVLASFFAGVAGALFAHYYSYLNPSTFNFNYSFQIIAMVVLGGMGSLSGSVTAAILLTVLLEALRPLQDYTGVDLRMVIYSLVLIVLMLTRPQGIFGRSEVTDFFKKRRSRPHNA
ncbi:MAG: branched-chain amino acid transporter, permease protein [Bacteriovoracaceae bacterium]|nr:branched-chain amino acid transporter, permease protein [Bacteriovoracaceae bacterium]